MASHRRREYCNRTHHKRQLAKPLADPRRIRAIRIGTAQERGTPVGQPFPD